MSKKPWSGHCRPTVFLVFVILALCATAASAATLSNNLAVSKVTQAFATATTTVPAYTTCPDGYICLTDTDAAATLGTYDKYSDAVCGYKQNTATLAAVIRTPQYCVKQTPPGQTPCPEGCSCMPESQAKEKFQGVYKQCSEKPCTTVVTGAAQVNAYCFGPLTTSTPPAGTCPEGCNCISEATAKAKGGSWSRCSADICGYEQSTATAAAVVQVPKYCMKQQETEPVCPDGCTCISDADAKLKGLTTKCDVNENPCGYQSVAGTATTAADRIPLSCYKNGITTITPTPICPDNCGGCMNEADAKAKFGPLNYTRCSEKVCGYDQAATTSYAQPKYCFRPTVTVTPASPVCPEGCSCITNATAAEKGLAVCGGKLTSCGYDQNKQPLYCFNSGAAPACAYDYEKNVCSGTCSEGFACGLLASEKDASGKIAYAACGCTGQSTTPCAYDAQKNACTGTCRNGASCAIVGRNIDEKSGKISVTCGCPQQSSCSYNYDKDACVGTCPVTGDACQVNTINRDPATGRVTYAECHCKGSGETPTACALDANNRCSGTCPGGGGCASITTKDDSGQEKVSCGCGGTPPGTPAGTATHPQGILESIGSFFSRLFGGK